MSDKIEFSEATKEEAWIRACGEDLLWARCECRVRRHRHRNGRCPNKIHWEWRGREGGSTYWEAHHKDPEGPDDPDNCLIVCGTCHEEITAHQQKLREIRAAAALERLKNLLE